MQQTVLVSIVSSNCLSTVFSDAAAKIYRKTCLKRPLKKNTEIDFQDGLSPNAGQKYCRMLQGEHSAILSTYIKLLFVIKIFVLSIFEWRFKTGLTVMHILCIRKLHKTAYKQN